MTQANSDNVENDVTAYSATETFLRRILSSEYLNVTDSSDIVNNNSGNYSDDGNITNYVHELHKEYIFDRKDVRYVFITLYSLVFCFCFFGEYFLWN